MGRGRAKAKQTKVARELKYSSQGTDLDALRAELAGSHSSDGHNGTAASEPVDEDAVESEADEDDDELYARYADEDD
jgi:hypothetical protein